MGWIIPKPKRENLEILLHQFDHENNPKKKGDKMVIYTDDLETVLQNGKTGLDNIVDEINSGTEYGWGYFKDTLKEYGVIEDDVNGKVKKAKKEDYMVSVKDKNIDV